MNFFQDLPSPPEQPRPAIHKRPEWLGPPSHELPAVIHVGKFLHRSPGVVVAVKSVEVFSTGCSIHVVWNMRQAEESDEDWAAARERFFQRFPSTPSKDRDPNSALLFGVAFPDGRTTTTAHVRLGMLDGSGPVTGPVLMMHGRGSHGGDDELTGSAELWVWPFPEGGDLRLVAQWKDAGMPEQSVVFDGKELTSAVLDVQKY